MTMGGPRYSLRSWHRALPQGLAALVALGSGVGTNQLELEGIWRERNCGIAISLFAIPWSCNSGTDLQVGRIAILDILL